jgi:hypothetical protein
MNESLPETEGFFGTNFNKPAAYSKPLSGQVQHQLKETNKF